MHSCTTEAHLYLQPNETNSVQAVQGKQNSSNTAHVHKHQEAQVQCLPFQTSSALIESRGTFFLLTWSIFVTFSSMDSVSLIFHYTVKDQV